MGRFSRRWADREWVRALGDPFTLDDVLAQVSADELEAALSWLYDAIEHGRLEPMHGPHGMSYRFTGERRAGDGAAGRFTSGRVRRP